MQKLIKNIVYIIISLIVLDVVIGYITKYPKNPFKSYPNSLQTYFNKGRSVTGRLKQMISEYGISGRAENGWIGSAVASDTLSADSINSKIDMKVRVYGMSFSNHMAEALHKIKPDAEVMLFHGGGAPPNYVLNAFINDSTKSDANIAVLGVYASGMYGALCNIGFTWNFEMGRPYTYSTYKLENDKVIESLPSIKTLENFKYTLYNNDDYNGFLNSISEKDPFYSSYLIKETIWDNSLVYRLIRKGYSSSHGRKVKSKYYSAKNGIKSESDLANSLKAIYKKFNDEARKAEVYPVVFLINTTGFSDHLYQFSKDYLKENKIPFISTHFSAPTTKREFFLDDGHFTEDANIKFAEELLEVYSNRLN